MHSSKCLAKHHNLTIVVIAVFNDSSTIWCGHYSYTLGFCIKTITTVPTVSKGVFMGNKLTIQNCDQQTYKYVLRLKNWPYPLLLMPLTWQLQPHFTGMSLSTTMEFALYRTYLSSYLGKMAVSLLLQNSFGLLHLHMSWTRKCSKFAAGADSISTIDKVPLCHIMWVQWHKKILLL